MIWKHIIFCFKGEFMLKYYAHSFSKTDNLMLSDFTKLEDILKNGYLLSRRKLGLSEEEALFNGMDYISLCDLEKKHPKNSAYNLYIKRGLSLLFDKKIEVVEPDYIYVDYNTIGSIDMMHYYGIKGRYSDLIDEVQVKDEVSLNYLRGIMLSLSRMQYYYTDEYIEEYLKVVSYLLDKYHLDIPIINLDNEKILKKQNVL